MPSGSLRIVPREMVTSRGNPLLSTAKYGSRGSPPSALNTSTLVPSVTTSMRAPAMRAAATSGTGQPRQRMRPSSQSGAPGTGSGSA